MRIYRVLQASSAFFRSFSARSRWFFSMFSSWCFRLGASEYWDYGTRLRTGYTAEFFTTTREVVIVNHKPSKHRTVQTPTKTLNPKVSEQ